MALNNYVNTFSKRDLVIVAAAMLFTLTAIVLGYLALGALAAFLFTFGYLGGLLIWPFVIKGPPFRQIALPYFVTLALFVLHKIEERQMDFFPALSKITGRPVPDPSSAPAILLYVIAFFWLLIPVLVWKRHELGYYLACTFFAAMGLTELAHFILPFFTGEPYSYFPGMYSVILLAPAAWWGAYKLFKNEEK